VYLAAYMPDAGESPVTLTASSAITAPIFAALRTTDAGRSYIDPASARDIVYNDCDEQTARNANARLAKMRPAFDPAISPVPWRAVASTYVVATNDRTVPVDVQRRMAQRAGEQLEWPTSHSPFLSRPDLVADLLVRLAREHA
jgi:pimeloyl-ACP methyl ester carboxylesterase